MDFRLILLFYLKYWPRLEVSFVIFIDFQVMRIKVGNTDQGLANYDLWAKCRPTSVFVNRFLLQHSFCGSLSVVFLVQYQCWGLLTDSVACKAKTIMGLWQRKYTDPYYSTIRNKYQNYEISCQQVTVYKKKAGQDPIRYKVKSLSRIANLGVPEWKVLKVIFLPTLGFTKYGAIS